MHVFAYNGKLGAFDQDKKLTGRFQPVGVSDSGFSFYYLLDSLAPLSQISTVSDLENWMDMIQKFAKKISEVLVLPILFILTEMFLFVHG